MTLNTAGRFGGAVYGEGEPVGHFVSCLANFNMSNDIGGSFYLYASEATIKLCTIVGNSGGANANPCRAYIRYYLCCCNETASPTTGYAWR